MVHLFQTPPETIIQQLESGLLLQIQQEMPILQLVMVRLLQILQVKATPQLAIMHFIPIPQVLRIPRPDSGLLPRIFPDVKIRQTEFWRSLQTPSEAIMQHLGNRRSAITPLETITRQLAQVR